MQYNAFLPVGSNHITNDLSIALHTPLDVAEDLKIAKGSLLANGGGEVKLSIIGDEKNLNLVSLDIVHNIVYSRMEETFVILTELLNKSKLKEQLGAGIILTGGMTLIEGTRELAQALIPNIPIRIGQPTNIKNISEDLDSPEFSTVIGLLQYESGKHTEYELEGSKTMLHSKEYQPKESLQDIASFQDIDASSKPKISLSTPSFNDDKNSRIDLFKDLSQEAQKNQNNPLDNFMDWAKKIF
jgi:cell division protein FtsA